jgi:Domain of unknown function (DUF5655)
MSWKCPKCDRTLKNANQWHCCINQDIDNLFIGKPNELMFAFDKILSNVFDFENVEISATKNCVVFFKTQTFLVIKPMKKELNIKFYLAEPQNIFPIFKVALYGKQYEHHIRLSTIEEVNSQLFSFFKQSHSLFNQST